MKINWTIIVGLIGLVLIGATGFVAYSTGYSAGNQAAVNVQREFFQNRAGPQGGQFGQNAQGQGFGNNSNAQGTPNAQNAQGGRGNLGRPIAAGTVKSGQGNTVVVTEQNGTAITVTVDAQTQIIKTVSGQVADIQPGMRVNVTGDQAATGSNPVTARLITVQSQNVPTQ